MTKNKVKFDKDAAFRSIIDPMAKATTTEALTESEGPLDQPPEEAAPKEELTLTPVVPTPAAAPAAPPQPKLMQCGFYITPRLHKALKLKAITTSDPKEKDSSSIVRSALEMYLADVLVKLDSEQ
jgi:hypothetical protein